MGSFKLGKMTLRSLFGKPATVQYPAEQVPAMSYEHMRGHVYTDNAVLLKGGLRPALRYTILDICDFC